MKRPATFLSLFFLSIICSTVIVTTAISSLCKAFYKDEAVTTKTVESMPEANAQSNVINASVKF
jgi:hypothetical protein